MNPEALVFDRYQLHERIGSGGMGVVWKATDQLLHQTVALKHVSFAQPAADQARLTRDRALREARLAAQLRSHPHVVSVYDVLVDDDGIWLVMEYLPARSLREFQQMYGKLDPVQVARIGARIADALAAGHALGIEHRDVKPSNILITTDGIVKLTDYGISHLIGDPSLTHTGISGTPAYLAPEVAGKGESGPASDVFSLGSTLYAAVEGQPPFGTDDNIFRLLNVVRTGIIRPPTHAGPLEPLLQRLLHVDPTTRPDAATVRDMLVRLTDPTPAGVRGRKQRTPRWWPARRRVALVTGALAAVAVTTAALLVAGIGTATPGDPLSPSIDADAPGDPRDVDPCALLNVEALGGFGRAQLTTPPFPASCEAGLITFEGDEFFLQVVLHQPGKSASELSGALRQIGDRTISRQDRRPVAATTAPTECQDWIMPVADEPLISITTLTYDDPAGLCAVTDATTTAAIEALERNGITYLPNRLASYSLASSDACTTLDDAILGRVSGVDPNDRYRGFANWSCFWDTTDEDGSRVELYFALGKHHPDAAQSTTIAGKKAFLYGQPQSCDAYVEHRPATGASSAETFFLTVKDPRPTEELCTLASDLATAVATRVPGSFRTADPCPLLNLDALRRFGALQPLPGPWLQSCAVDISTANGGTARLRVVLEKYKDELGGIRDQIGDLTIFRDDSVSYWGTKNACRRDLVSASDQPRITIYAFNKGDKPIDLCAIAEATTATAIDALDRNKGLTYDPDRISSYGHATSDACTTLDTTALSKVPHLDLNDELPEFANWSCRWGTTDNGGTKVSLLLRSEDSEILSGHYEDLESTFAADKAAFIDGKKPEICKVYVVRQRIDTAVEIFEVKVESTRPATDLCGPAIQLATAAEQRLPG